MTRAEGAAELVLARRLSLLEHCPRKKHGARIGHAPEENPDGPLRGGGDLGPLEDPLDHGREPASEHQAVEASKLRLAHHLGVDQLPVVVWAIEAWVA